MERSRGYDRELKLPLYARFRIREVWLIDLRHSVVETYRRPALRGYRDHARVTRGHRLAPVAFTRTSLRVDDLLG